MKDFLLSRHGFVCILLAALLAACNRPQSPTDITPTLNVTQAYQTVEARLTQAIAQTPQVTATLKPTDPGIPTPTVTSVPQLTTPAPTSIPVAVTKTPNCDLASPGNPIDVTIPDDTPLQPGQAFTKIWRLQNSGSCIWNREYRAELFSGDAMSAPASVQLPASVAPGSSVDIAVDMVAPNTPGTYQGNWKLRNASKDWFGIGPSGSAPFWVKIVVVQSSTATVTQSAAAPTATSTPVVRANATITMIPGSRVDLDNGQLNTGSGEELSYETNADGKHLLAPQGSTTIGIYGPSQPSQANCLETSMGTNPPVIESIGQGAYLCYRTNLGQVGRAYISSFNPDDYSLVMEIVTWGIP